MKVHNPTKLLRPILATLLPLGAFILQWMFWPYVQPYVWFLFYPAVFFSAWIGGLSGGLIATVISATLVMYFFMPPQFSFAVEYPKSFLSAGVFVAMGVLFGYTQERVKKANRETVEALAATRSANDQLETRVRERTAELVQTNVLMQANEARYRSALDNMLEGCQIIGFDWRYLYLNDSATQHGQRARDELLGRTMMEAYPGIEDTDMFSALRHCMAERTLHRMENRFDYGDGTSAWFDFSIRPVPEGIFIISLDITERKQAEEALRESEERYRSLFENMLDGFAYCRMLFENNRPQDFIYLDVNSAFEKLTGLKNVVGRKVTEVITGIRESNPELFEIYGRVALSGKPERFETYVEPLGIWFSISVYCPEREHFVAVFDNITVRKRAETALAAKNEEIKAMTQQLWQTAKLATMGELAASVAHELNNPLGTVSLRIESLIGQVPADDPKRRELEVVEREVERMSTLVASLLQFSRRGTPQISTVDVGEEIENTLELIHYLLRQRQITVQREFAPDVPMVPADRQQLRQLFLNLFTNAADAMLEGGTLTIRVSAAEKQVLIEIVDTGVGIAPEDLPKVTEPFFTTKPEGKGTGLGLAICRRIVQEHNGTFDLTSAGPGRGATVRIALPVKNGSNGTALRRD